MIKVCHITSVHKQFDVRIFEKECVSLSKFGYEVNLLVRNGAEGVFNGVNIYSIAIKGGRLNRIFRSKNLFLIKALEINADIYHFHDPELLPLGLKLIKKGKKVIYDVHEDVPRQILDKIWIPKIFRYLISKIFELYEKRTASKMSGIVSAAPVITKRFVLINKNVIEICNFPIIHFFDENTHLNFENRPKQVLYIGGLFRTRGIIEMLDAINGLEAKLVLAGEFENEDLKNECINHPGWSNVDYLGFINRDEIRKQLNLARAGLVVLHPTKAYIHSYPVKMFEYMAAGLPVIASDFELWKEFVLKNECGFCINPFNTEDLRNAIVKMININSEAETMGQNGKNIVKEQYNWEIESLKLERFYKNLI